MARQWILEDERQTERLAQLLYDWLLANQFKKSSYCVYMRGTLGAGKSALTRALLRAAGVTENIPSPTYTLVESYTASGMKFVHVDAFRLADSEELMFLGSDAWTQAGTVLIVEWPDQVLDALPHANLELTLEYDPDVAAFPERRRLLVEGDDQDQVNHLINKQLFEEGECAAERLPD